jgi:hypothetical protein
LIVSLFRFFMSFQLPFRAARLAALCSIVLVATLPAHAGTAAGTPAVLSYNGRTVFGGENLDSIGIGTNRPATVLDAPFGEIKPGSSGAACTAQIAGAIRYANARLQVCDGASWRVVALEPAR